VEHLAAAQAGKLLVDLVVLHISVHDMIIFVDRTTNQLDMAPEARLGVELFPADTARQFMFVRSKDLVVDPIVVRVVVFVACGAIVVPIVVILVLAHLLLRAEVSVAVLVGTFDPGGGRDRGRHVGSFGGVSLRRSWVTSGRRVDVVRRSYRPCGVSLQSTVAVIWFK
jgi:hypothetical protein